MVFQRRKSLPPATRLGNGVVVSHGVAVSGTGLSPALAPQLTNGKDGGGMESPAVQQPSQPSSGTTPFQPHVGTGKLLAACAEAAAGGHASPARGAAHLGTAAQLQDLLKIGKPLERERRRTALRDAILQLFPSQVKGFVRDNEWTPIHPIRRELWADLCRNHAGSASRHAEGFYWETVDQVFGKNHMFVACMRSQTLRQCIRDIKEERPEECANLPCFVDPSHQATYHLAEKGNLVARRVVCVLGYTHPDITYCPGLYGLASLFLHYMSEEDAYNGLCTLVQSRQGKFLHQTKLGYEAAWRTVYTLTKKHAKAAFAHLGKFAKSSDQVERIFENWYWWIFKQLPFSHLVRVVDCYLYEGMKVLYRVAMAIIILFAKSSSKPDMTLYQEANHSGLRPAINKFCNEMPVSPGKLLKVAFGIRGLRQRDINCILLRIEMSLKSRNIASGGPAPITRSFSSEGMPTSQSQINIHNMSHTLNVRELLTLWSWLPARITMYQPELIYTTEEHGCSLMTFYTKVQNHEPTLVIIKTMNDEIFGAYCSTKWAERNFKGTSGQKQTYFGTGETFLFTIYPEMKKYPWIGLTHNSAESTLKHSAELFMAGDNHMITIGGGNGQAIWIDENVRHGGTASCDTFENPPLSFSPDFECKVVEVIGFT